MLEKNKRNMYYLEPNENLTNSNWCKRAQNTEQGKEAMEKYRPR